MVALARFLSRLLTFVYRTVGDALLLSSCPPLLSVLDFRHRTAETAWMNRMGTCHPSRTEQPGAANFQQAPLRPPKKCSTLAAAEIGIYDVIRTFVCVLGMLLLGSLSCR